MGLHFLNSAGSLHIDGHKEKTIYHAYKQYLPPKVYIPAVDRRGEPLRNMVEGTPHVDRGELLGLGIDDFPTYSSVSGRILGHKMMRLADGRVCDCFEILTDNNVDYYRAKRPLPSPEECSASQIINAMKDSACIGQGGAGFPTYLKYKTDKPIKYIIVNAVECEPYLTADVTYSMANMQLLFVALHYLERLTACKRIYIAVKKDRPFLIDRIKQHMKRKENRDIHVSLSLMPDRYPMGYERTLVKRILGKDYDNLPIEVGCVVNNISTLMNLGKRFMLGEVATSRNVTVSGEVKEPADIVVPNGTLASDLINYCGGPVIPKFKIIAGGPMCGNAFPSDFVCTMATNGVLLMAPSNTKADPCWHCGDCQNTCPVGLQPVQIQLALKANNIDRILALHAEKCCGCGLCSYVCPSRITVSDNVTQAKQLALAEIERRKNEPKLTKEEKKALAQAEKQAEKDAEEAAKAEKKAAKEEKKAAKAAKKAAKNNDSEEEISEEASAPVNDEIQPAEENKEDR